MLKKNYLFHFIVSGNICNKIVFLKEKLGINKNSKLIDFLLSIISINYSNIKNIIGDHGSEYCIIDINDSSRIDKYLRINSEKYKILKKWHYLFNEYSISAILRDIIIFFYNGIVKYGVNKFINMISKCLKTERIFKDIRYRLTHISHSSIKKEILFSFIIENLRIYV